MLWRLCAVLLPLLAPLDAMAQWQELGKLVPDEGAPADGFGSTLALDGDLLVIGAPGQDKYGDDAGAAHLYRNTTEGWVPVAILSSPDPTPGEGFGDAVGISESTVVVGVPDRDSRGEDAGAAFVFQPVDGEWTCVAELSPLDSAAGDWFGEAVAIDGDTVLISAPGDDPSGSSSGSAYIFRATDGQWQEVYKAVPADGDAWDFFGLAVALQHGTAAIGAPWEDRSYRNSGSVYLFRASDGGWGFHIKLTATDSRESDGFGRAVSLDEGFLAVGASGAQWDGVRSGAAYVFREMDGLWEQTAKVGPTDGAASDLFGWPLCLDARILVAGSRSDDGFGNSSGAAYIFRSDGDLWTEEQKLVAHDSHQHGLFGRAVAISGSHAAIGAWDDSSDTTDVGSVYVFAESSEPCPADFYADGVADSRDVIAYLNAWVTERTQDCSAGGCSADFDENGAVDTRDFVQFLNAWAAGC